MAIYKSKKPTKDGRQYFFRVKYKDIMGEVHDYSSPKFAKRREAEEEEARFKIKVANKEAYVSSVTFEQAYLSLEEEKKKTIKKQNYRKEEQLHQHLKVFDEKKINDINLVVYKQFINNLSEKKLSVKYKNMILSLFRQVIRHSTKYYNTSDMILKYVSNFKDVNKFKEEMQFFTYEEYQKFINVVDEFEWKVFFEVLYFMGTRQGECQALTWKDIDLEKETLNINKTLTTKIKGERYTISTPKTKSSIRTLPLPKNLLEDLKSLNDEAKKYKDYKNSWFVFGNSLPFPETTIQKRKNKYCELAGVKQIRIHDFRHSCASLLIHNGASIVLVSKWLGHSKTSITYDIYTHLYQSELIDMVAILDNLK